MHLPHGLIIAVVDGEKLNLYSNSGDERHPKLVAFEHEKIGGDNKSSGSRHHSSAANPDDSRQDEDSFAAAVAAKLNEQVLDGYIEHLFVIATPKTLGELRKHYHKILEQKLIGDRKRPDRAFCFRHRGCTGQSDVTLKLNWPRAAS